MNRKVFFLVIYTLLITIYLPFSATVDLNIFSLSLLHSLFFSFHPWMDIKILQSVQVSDIIVVVIDANYIVLHIRKC